MIIGAGVPSSTCASPVPRKSNTTGSPRRGSISWPTAPWRWAGRAIRSHVFDEDLGVSGSGLVDRAGFARMTAEVALGEVGIVLGLEVSRLARNNADWYRLLDLCGVTHTLIGDADGIYHPGLFNSFSKPTVALM